MEPEGTQPHLPSESKIDIADGALEHIRALHNRLGRRPTPLTRLRRGLGRALNNRWRLHRYPRSFVKGFRDLKPVASDLTQLARLIKAQRFDQALAVGAAWLPSKLDDSTFLRAARKVFTKTGAVSLNAHATAALRRVADTPRLELYERHLAGRIRETDLGWLPAVDNDIATSFSPMPNRILHVLKASVPHRQSGYTMRTQYLIDGQRFIGLDPIAVTALGFPRNIGITEFKRSEVINGTSYLRLDVGSGDLLEGPADVYLDAYAEHAAPLVLESRPSVLHVHSGHRGYEAALVGMALARCFDLPLVYEVRGFFESMWSRDPSWNERGELYRRRLATDTNCMHQSDAVVTLSESMRSEILERGVSPAKVFVVPNGVDTQSFRPGPRDQELVVSLGLTDSFVFGYVSNLDHYREGQELLIRAASALAASGVRAKALIVGDGSRRTELESVVAEENAEDVVIFTGQVPHNRVADYYRLLDVFVVPRVPERAARLVTPLKPFEAMAAGVPVVVSELPPLVEIIGNGERGRSFPPGDPDRLAEVLIDLWKDEGLRADLARRGRSWVEAERQWSSIAALYKSIYEHAEDAHG